MRKTKKHPLLVRPLNRKNIIRGGDNILSNRQITFIENNLKSKLALGESRFESKVDGSASSKIFSINTYKTYKRQIIYFIEWCKENKGITNPNKAKEYCEEYIQSKRESGASAWTQQTIRSAFSKYYEEDMSYIKCDTKARSKIQRGRYKSVYASGFSEEKNEDLVNFCMHTGLRRCELKPLKGKDLIEKDGKYYIHVKRGKGGRPRDVYILDQDVRTIEMLKNTPQDRLVFGKITKHANIHKYRSDYACALYKSVAREEIPKEDRYYCKRDMAGTVLDRKAMRIVSNQLGHNRLDVIAQHYLYQL